MKFVKLLILLSIFSLTLSSKLKISENPEYKVVVLGDNGEYKLWKTQYDTVMKDNTSSVKIKTEQIFAFGKYVLDGSKCTYTPVGESDIELTTRDSADKYGMKT
jgi:hypothetical protein